MKAYKKITAAALIIGMSMVAGQAGAGQGQGNRNGNDGTATTGTMPTDICAGDEIIVGTVTDAVQFSGTGLQLDTDEGMITVYGIGPLRYWDAIEVDRPTVGEEVTVDARQVVFSDGSEKTIAVSLTIGEDSVELRDAETCIPLWRGGGNYNLSALSVDSDFLLARGGQGRGGHGPGNGTGNGGTGPGGGTGNGSKNGDCING